MIRILDLVHTLLITFAIPALIMAAGEITRRKRERRALLRYVTQSQDGELYVTDPQTGETHKFRDILARQLVPHSVDQSKRQAKIARKKLRRAMASSMRRTAP